MPRYTHIFLHLMKTGLSSQIEDGISHPYHSMEPGHNDGHGNDSGIPKGYIPFWADSTDAERCIEQKIDQLKSDSHGSSAYIIKVELLAAKNLIGANLNGMSDPNAIITCGTEKRFRDWLPFII